MADLKKKQRRNCFAPGGATNLPGQETIFRNDEQTKYPITLFDLNRDTFLSRKLMGIIQETGRARSRIKRKN